VATAEGLFRACFDRPAQASDRVPTNADTPPALASTCGFVAVDVCKEERGRGRGQANLPANTDLADHRVRDRLTGHEIQTRCIRLVRPAWPDRHEPIALCTGHRHIQHGSRRTVWHAIATRHRSSVTEPAGRRPIPCDCPSAVVAPGRDSNSRAGTNDVYDASGGLLGCILPAISGVGVGIGLAP
jgi:hypothetical protein